jgi:hypothetical protein
MSEDVAMNESVAGLHRCDKMSNDLFSFLGFLKFLTGPNVLEGGERRFLDLQVEVLPDNF